MMRLMGDHNPKKNIPVINQKGTGLVGINEHKCVYIMSEHLDSSEITITVLLPSKYGLITITLMSLMHAKVGK